MNLDDIEVFARIDSQDMLGQIQVLPDQIEAAWELSQTLPLTGGTRVRQVILSGMGDSAIGGDMLAAYAAPHCQIPVILQRDYDLPAWASGPDTLLVIVSHSGNTEEILSSFDRALAAGCHCLAITTGGELAQLASRAGIPVWQFEHDGQARSAVGYSFTLQLGLLARLGILPDPSADLTEAVRAMRSQQPDLSSGTLVAANPAKRMAGQLVGRLPVIFGSGLLAPVARRWKTQINLMAKAWAEFEFLPEADHNTLAGTQHPEALLSRVMALFLMGAVDHPRNRLRSELTRQILMTEGLNTDTIMAQGESALAQLWTCLHFGDYTAYYLAMAYGVDPTPLEIPDGLKQILSTTE